MERKPAVRRAKFRDVPTSTVWRPSKKSQPSLLRAVFAPFVEAVRYGRELTPLAEEQSVLLRRTCRLLAPNVAQRCRSDFHYWGEQATSLKVLNASVVTHNSRRGCQQIAVHCGIAATTPGRRAVYNPLDLQGLPMKNTALGIAVIGALLGTPALAAEMPLKAPPAPLAPLWTGWYIGANVGGSFGSTTQTASFPATIIPPTSPFGSVSSDLDGVIGGGQIGYNWQNGIWVLGIEADIDGTSERASSYLTGTGTISIPSVGLFTDTGTVSFTEKLNWLGTVRGRLGVTVSPNWLLYATGGLAYGGLDSDTALTVGALSAANNFTETRAGWTTGAGIEGWLGHNWTAKLEYLYVDLGSFTDTFTGVGLFTPVTLTTHVTDNIVRVGLNYHFN
jgi:outer membrane immunogenic protein